MSNFVISVLYLLVFRLAIVAAGTVAIVIGYRLFCSGIAGSSEGNRASSIDSSVAGMKFSLRNAAPGTLFALFGASLISVMLVQSSPSVDWQSMKPEQPQTSSSNQPAEKFQVRGDNQASGSLGGLTSLGQELEDHGKTADAERAYKKAVMTIAEPINDLASIYASSGRGKEAIGLATLAVQLNPNETRFSKTLAQARTAAK